MSWRKSWPKLNIYGTNGDGKCSKRQLTPDERSVWDDYLDLAQLSHIRGKVCIATDIGYTQEQLSKILKTPVDIINRAEHNLLKLKMIEIDKNRVITLLNWKKYQSEYNRQLQYRVTSKGNTKVAPIDTDTETEPETVTDKDIKRTEPSKELKAAFDKLLNDGFNIYSLLNRLKKESKVGAEVPEEVLLRVCDSYWKNKPKKAWPWFTTAITQEWQAYNARLHEQESETIDKRGPIASSLKGIMKGIR